MPLVMPVQKYEDLETDYLWLKQGMQTEDRTEEVLVRSEEENRANTAWYLEISGSWSRQSSSYVNLTFLLFLVLNAVI